MAESNILEVKNLSIQFGGLRAVDGLNMTIKDGQLYGLIGPNGAGKTTIFNLITGVYALTEGRVIFDGTVVGQGDAIIKDDMRETDVKPFRKQPYDIMSRGMARTFQNIRLWKSQTVFDNVLIAKHMLRTSNVFSATFCLNRKEEAQHREEVMELLRIVGLEDVKDELATSLPYGKQRRLEIARALATHPKLLMLDAPAAGMRPQETNELTEIIGRIRDEFHMTILLIEQNANMALKIADYAYVLETGNITKSGTGAELLADESIKEAYLGKKKS